RDLALGAEVTGAVLEAADRDRRLQWARRGLARIGEVGGRAAVVVVLGEMAVGEHAPLVDLLGERVVAARTVVHPDASETHRLVPRRLVRVVGGRDAQRV